MKKMMKQHSILSLFVLILLSAAMAFSVTSCANDDDLVEGEKQVRVEVYSADGTVETFTVRTEKTTVGEALLEEGLISGENSTYGLMIYEVNGERHVYDEDGSYWAFYINGEYAMTGVSSTDINENDLYAFKVE